MMFDQFPMMGHDGEIADTREFKVTGLPYLVVYRLASATELDILTVIHSARKYP